MEQQQREHEAAASKFFWEMRAEMRKENIVNLFLVVASSLLFSAPLSVV